MKRKISITQIFTFFLAIIFLFTSCPQPVNQQNQQNQQKKDYGTINHCYIDENGNPTDDEGNSFGKLYWVEKDGKIQPGLATVSTKDKLISVVNIFDEETGTNFRMYFMPGANLPYRLIVECADEEKEKRTIVGSEIGYDQENNELSLLLTDNNTGKSERLSGVKLNSELFKYKIQNETDNYLVTMAACFLYALDCHISQPSEIVNRSWAGFWSGVFSVVAVVTFVVAVVLAPEIVVAGAAISMEVTAANAVWAGVAVASTVTAVTLGITETVLNQNGAYETTEVSSPEVEPEPPNMLIYKVDSEGNPTETPNVDDCFENDGFICLHCNDEEIKEQIFCVEFIGSARPLSIEIGQSKYCRDLHTIKMFEDFDSNTQSSLNYIPDKFYFSIVKNDDYYPNGDFLRVFMFMRITTKQEGVMGYINGKEAKLTTQLVDEDGNVVEAAEHKNVYKVKICTDELRCPLIEKNIDEISNEI